jgi:hypothetical protein
MQEDNFLIRKYGRALSGTAVSQAADEGSTAPLALSLSQLPLPEPIIEAVPLEQSPDKPMLSPPPLLAPTEEVSSEDTVAEIETHTAISSPAALSTVMPTEREELKIVEGISLDEPVVPLPPPPAAEAVKRSRRVENEKALIFNEESPHQRQSPHAHLPEREMEEEEKGPLASAAADSGTVNTEDYS